MSDSVTLCTIACQDHMSIGFFRKYTGVGFSSLLQGIFPDPGIEPSSVMFPELAVEFFTTSATWEAHILYINVPYIISINTHIYTVFIFWSRAAVNPFWMIAIFQIFFTILLHICHLWKFTKKCRGKINACLKTKTPNKTIETHSLEFSDIFNMYMEESTR